VKLYVETIAQRMGLRRKVNIWLSDLVDGPLTLGFYKPIILFPLALINQLSMEQVEAIILHELAHIRRNDYVINLVISWLGIIFFFNPFARMLIREIRKEREHCCDDLVLQFQYEPHTYASALLALERSRFEGSALVLAAAGTSRQLLLERVKRISGQKVPVRRFSFSAMVFLFISLTGSQFLTINPVHQNSAAKSLTLALKRDKTQITYVTAGFNAKTVQPVQKLILSKKHPSIKNKVANHDLIWVKATNDQDDEMEVAPAIESDDRAFSIESSAHPADAQVTVKGMNHPYVQSKSFSYHLQVDTSTYTIIGKNAETQYALENVTLALTELNTQIPEMAGAQPKSMTDAHVMNDVMNYSTLLNPDLNTVVTINSDHKKMMPNGVKWQLLAPKKADLKDRERFIILQRTMQRDILLKQKKQLENELKVFKIAPVRHERKVVYI
jgi:hypothetical protein